MIRRESWINYEALTEFICKSQDSDLGGISDRPGNEPDVFHSFFGIAAISLMGGEGLEVVDPVFALPRDVLARIFG